MALFLLGDGNCGKSTVMHCVERMLPEGSVGTISGKTETTFAFQSLFNKRCILVYDLSRDFHKYIDQQQYQSIISGEHVSVARKNKDPVSLHWKTPLMMSGNYLLQYTDESGSISRRVFAAEFRNHIVEYINQR